MPVNAHRNHRNYHRNHLCLQPYQDYWDLVGTLGRKSDNCNMNQTIFLKSSSVCGFQLMFTDGFGPSNPFVVYLIENLYHLDVVLRPTVNGNVNQTTSSSCVSICTGVQSNRINQLDWYACMPCVMCPITRIRTEAFELSIVSGKPCRHCPLTEELALAIGWWSACK